MFSKIPQPHDFQASVLPEFPTPHDFEPVARDYRIMLLCVLNAILDRCGRRSDYHFIDTKLSLLTGRDFDHDDPIRGPAVIYPWIQGRALEALAGHERWLQNDPQIDAQLRRQLSQRIRIVMAEVVSQMETLRKLNHGRLFFMMTPQGQTLRISDNGQVTNHNLPAHPPFNFSDLFYVKGLAAAAHVLGRTDLLADAGQWFLQICRDIRQNRFVSDQQPLDPANVAVKPLPNRFSHAPRMIAIAAASRFLKCTHDPIFRQEGLQFLEHILDLHVNRRGDNELSRTYDMWEFIDPRRQPFLDDQHRLLSDPGHACEFVGFALDLLRTSPSPDNASKAQIKIAQSCQEILCQVLKQNFANGFSPHGFGIFNAVDLVTRKPINTYMPWWSLPETTRAALAACALVPAPQYPSYAAIAAHCSNAFVRHYVKPSLHLMAVQTLNETGQPVDVIPATPDADPGYHTGLAIIDCLELLPKITTGL